MRIIAVVMLAVLVSGCSRNPQWSDPHAGAAAPPPPPTSTSPPIATDWPEPPIGSRWVAQGIACGVPWDMELTIEKDRVLGTMHRGILEYRVTGELDKQGVMRGGLAERRTPFGPIGPRFFDVQVTFSARFPNGRFEAQDYPTGESCPTLFQMRRVAR